MKKVSPCGSRIKAQNPIAGTVTTVVSRPLLGSMRLTFSLVHCADRGPAQMGIAQFNSVYERMGHGHLLPDSTRLVRQLPSGMRFYTIATSAGGLCLANVYPPGGSNAKGGWECGDSLSQSRPITIGSQRPNRSVPPISFGLAIDGVTAVSFTAGGAETTVPVKGNVWAYEGQANLRSVTVHWADGSAKTLIDGR